MAIGEHENEGSKVEHYTVNIILLYVNHWPLCGKAESRKVNKIQL